MEKNKIHKPENYMCLEPEDDLYVYETFECEHCLDNFCYGCFEQKETSEGKFCQGCYEDYKEGHDEDYVV